MWDEIKAIKSDKKTLREFGLTIGAILVILGGVALWRGRGAYVYLITAGILSIVLGAAMPRALKPPQKIWMALGVVLGFFVSRVILGTLFYLVITPINMVIRLLRKDILDQRIDKKAVSYWKNRDEAVKPKSSYENQY